MIKSCKHTSQSTLMLIQLKAITVIKKKKKKMLRASLFVSILLRLWWPEEKKERKQENINKVNNLDSLSREIGQHDNKFLSQRT